MFSPDVPSPSLVETAIKTGHPTRSRLFAASVTGVSERPTASRASVVTVQGAKTIAPFSGGEQVKNHTLNVWRTHDGIDLAAEKGTVVTAAEAGTVSAVTMDPMWGGTVAVDHTDGTQTIYCGIAPEKALKAGDRVTAGQMLGSVDTVTAEVAMESHLHFAAKKDGKFIDPLSLPGLE